MPITKCRVCDHDFFEAPLLHFKNMPSVAQSLPDAASVKEDKGIDIEVYQCSGCGLVQLNSPPVLYYKNVIRASAFSKEMKNFRIKQFQRFVDDYCLKEKKLIEIGCGCGEYMSIMQHFGVETFGLEYSETSVSQCIQSGLNVFQGFIHTSHYRINSAPFNGFYILNFLEHLPDPNTFLTGIYNNLAENAIGLVEVPNFDMILKKNLFSEFTSDHLLYFTKETLNSLLKQNGFEIITCDDIWHDYIISSIVKKRTKLNIFHFYNYQTQLKDQLHEYIEHFSPKKVAIWGAGHQALAIISLANLADKIRYVIDSATFKQGKFTPATHIPIVSPDTIILDTVEAIIVMAASYSDEVAGIIRKSYPPNINISILRNYGLEII